MSSKFKERKENRPLIVLIAAFIVMGAAIMAATLLPGIEKNTEVSAASEKGNLVVDTNATSTEDDLSKVYEILKDRNVYFSGIQDCNVTKETNISLENLKENEEIFMTYTIYDEAENVIFSTDLIPSGQAVNFEVAQYLCEGEHNLKVFAQPYYPTEAAEGGYLPLTSTSNMVKVTVL
ncbi:MAG: hypothetical protein K6B41_10260 [Butyrivibrio sp.]|nr:hypothetical protein [Butyrivibrio sp.]